MVTNSIIQKLPNHLKGFVADQQYDMYTPQDQAVWRYVMKQNLRMLPSLAHETYLQGLEKTGINIERIPGIDEMNEILGKMGWAAVAVDGFIPPAAFMEFQKHRVLVIAADIRSLEQIQYTPAPDIIHEAAGHAPIIADEQYATYLRNFGEIGSKAFSSKKDYELYEAIRHLSILKADPHAVGDKVERAEAQIALISENMGMPSEMAYIRNLHWWTVEYGLVGTLQQPKIYGAGLLSSISEGIGAMSEDVVKLPYSLDAMYYNFDITKPQPQLFVTPDFQHLNVVLEEFANQMALRQGGVQGLLKAIESGNTATAQFASGIQVSGTFTEVLVNNGQAIYLKTKGPTILSYADKMLPGHNKTYHIDGFSSPIGRIKGALKPTRLMSDTDLANLKIIRGQWVDFEFESGIVVQGNLTDIVRKSGFVILLTLEKCLVKHDNQVLFDPAWGSFDMAVGETIPSVFNGPADPEGFGLSFEPPVEKTHRVEYSSEVDGLCQLYSQVYDMRRGVMSVDYLQNVWSEYGQVHANNWLLGCELYELAQRHNLPLMGEIKIHLEKLMIQNTETKELISNILG